MRVEPITPEDVDEALYHLHPNKDDWTDFERSNMERALHLFLVKRVYPDAYAFLSAEWRGWIILPSQSSRATLKNLLSSAGGSQEAAMGRRRSTVAPPLGDGER